MINFTKGNLLQAEAEALVNTVNTVGVMGKGIALMFKEAFPDNFRAYERACKDGQLHVGDLLIFQRKQLGGPKWIVNFPTKKHWRNPSQLAWIEQGLAKLRNFIIDENVKSIALPPLGSGNGGLDWAKVKPIIVAALDDLSGVQVIVYEPTREYQNVAKRKGVEKLTPARAVIAELVRRYSILGIECSLLEIHKLAYFFERQIQKIGGVPSLDLRFEANLYGPYAHRLSHLIDGLDGSYLHCEKRIADASPFDTIRFDDGKKEMVAVFLTRPDARIYRPVLQATSEVIDGFESPLGMELLATVDWLVAREGAPATVEGIVSGLRAWPGGDGSGARKMRLFDERMIGFALEQLNAHAMVPLSG
jgi:O-acetyl-ADP-ribose deacetylase (regulator of RNase III)